MRKLIELGANINIKGENGKTPLMCAAIHKTKVSVDALLERNADPNIQDHDGFTALMYWAGGWGSEVTANLLLNTRTDINLVNNSGWTALVISVVRGDTEFVKKLIEAGADINQICTKATALMFASARGNMGCLKELIQAGADLNLRGDGEKSAVMSPYLTDQSPAGVKALVDAGAEIEVPNLGDHAGYLMLLLSKRGTNYW